MIPDTRPTVAAPDDDPYLWLEDIDGEAACAWADGRTRETNAALAGERLETDVDALRTIFDRPDRIPAITRRGGLVYNFWRDDAHPRGLWRRTTMDDFSGGDPAWDVLLDVDALAEADGEDWIWHGATTRQPRHDCAILNLSRGGSDAVVLREFDIEKRAFVPDGFIVPEAKGFADWLDDDTLLLSSAYGSGHATRAGYPRTARLWQRGDDPAAARVLFEVPAASMSAWAGYDREHDCLNFGEQIDFYRHTVWIGDRSGAKTKIDLPDDAEASWHAGHIVVRPRTAWTVVGQTYAPDTVLGIARQAFLDGARDFRVLFTPERRKALQSVGWAGGHVIIAVLDELRPTFLRVVPDEDWRIEAMTGLPSIGMVSLWRLDENEDESNGDLLVMSQTPIQPQTLSVLQQTMAAPSVLRRAPGTFDPGAAVVTQHEAVASDGERIPYVQVGPSRATGEAPVYMTGYGGLRVSSLPRYDSIAGKLWIERGGTCVTANLRGGGEFGTWWHDAGRREGKARSHDDFAAVAADLVQRGVTRPARIAAEGGSNGGLLIANMLTRHPEKFGALLCTIPLVDMRRYTKLLAGASWIAEYGDPDRPEDWAFLAGMSAYHAAEAGQPYPPILIATSRRDDRVHPGHARKFAAKLTALGYAPLFYEPAAGGHGYGKDNAEIARFSALGLTFLRRAIGWEVGES